MKKGISLIVLVITIIVMIIIAGAIIVSINSNNVITKANQAVTAQNLQNIRDQFQMDYAEYVASSPALATTTAMAYYIAQKSTHASTWGAATYSYDDALGAMITK